VADYPPEGGGFQPELVFDEIDFLRARRAFQGEMMQAKSKASAMTGARA
jgi:hypothetical protein